MFTVAALQQQWTIDGTSRLQYRLQYEMDDVSYYIKKKQSVFTTVALRKEEIFSKRMKDVIKQVINIP